MRHADSSQQRHRGSTLITLMVGIVLAMVASLALLFAYRAIVLDGLSAKAAAKQQDQGASASVAFITQMGQAGWGDGPTATPPGGAANTDIVLLSGATLSGSTLSGTPTPITSKPSTGNAVVWDTQVNGPMQCSAMLITNGGVQRLGPTPCTSAADWAQLNWTQQNALIAPGVFKDATFSVHQTICWPFGGGNGLQPAVQVTLNNAGSVSNSVCLVNIPN